MLCRDVRPDQSVHWLPTCFAQCFFAFLLQRYFTAGVGGNEPEKAHCYFLAEQSTAATQRLMRARQLVAATGDEGVAPYELAVSWNALLRYASQQARARKKGSGRFALILDEFPFLVMQTPDLPSILQAWWDREGAHSPLFVVQCGSQLSAMAALGAESAPLFGRFNAGIFHIDPPHYEDVACFYEGGRHYRVIAPLASDLQFSDPAAVYAAHVALRLADYMAWFVFEEVCEQWLQQHAKQRLGLTIRQMARYWSRDGRTEINIVAELDNGTFLFAE